MKHRYLVAAIAVVALAVPAAAEASLAVHADATGQYGPGRPDSKTWIAGITGGDIYKITFAQPMLNQIDPQAAAVVLTTTEDAGCDYDNQTTCLGNVAVSVNGSGTALDTLPIDYGQCSDMVKIPAPPADGTQDATGEAQIIVAGSVVETTLTQLGSPIVPTCIGVRIDAWLPGGTFANGKVELSVLLAPLAQLSLGIHVTNAALTLNNVAIGPVGHVDLFTINPLTPDTVDSTISVVPCSDVMAPCDTPIAPVSDTVQETRGGLNTVSLSALSSKIRFGRQVHLTGLTTRGDVASIGETVALSLVSGLGVSSPIQTVTGDGSGVYDSVWTANKSGTIHVSSFLDGSPHSNSYTTDSGAIEVVAGTPTVRKTLSHKQTIRRRVYYDVKLTITVPAGLKETVTVGSKHPAKTSHGSAMSFIFRKVRDNTLIRVASTATGVTSGSKSLRV